MVDCTNCLYLNRIVKLEEQQADIEKRNVEMKTKLDFTTDNITELKDSIKALNDSVQKLSSQLSVEKGSSENNKWIIPIVIVIVSSVVGFIFQLVEMLH